ncbi:MULTISPECIES: hypothetical protein [unclassified Bacillus (in: firmicutes)]|uniref:hypothetical protein n=1 Tax=unclassified Bacillus (in: firmicutes) TaxID=185979 RepID=UPI002034C54C|nr:MULTISPECIES: hypothetical protein [unclassified Bacillus (in: firmicutes)]
MTYPGFRFEKIWTDVDFFEAHLGFYGSEFNINLDTYTDNISLNELRLGLLSFVERLGKSEFLWKSGHEKATHYLSMRFFLQEKRGIVGVEVNLDNNMEPPNRFRSNFYLLTELNQFDDLARKIEKLIKEEINDFEGLYSAN